MTREMERDTNSYPSSEQGNNPVLTIDLKKKRLRLYKQSLKAIGNPEYVQFLVDPVTHKLVIRSSDEKDWCAQRIYWTILNDKGQCCEFYSKDLLEMMRLHFFPSDKLRSYRVSGATANRKSLIVFDLNESVPIADEEA